MSVPCSLRLCCMAAMAPALTEAATQSRITLTGTPPPAPSETPVVNGGLNGATSKDSPKGPGIASVSRIPGKKRVVSVSSCLNDNVSRGLLKPIQGNGRTVSIYTINSSKSDKGLKPNLGIIKNLPIFCKQISTPQQNGQHFSSSAAKQNMNQPINGNGPNGTGKRFIRTASVTDTKTFNGHGKSTVGSNLQGRLPQQHGISLMKTEHLPRNSAIKQGQPMCRSPAVTATSNTNTTNSITPSSSVASRPESASDAVAGVNLESQSCSAAKVVVKALTEVSETEPAKLGPVDLIQDADRKEHLLVKRSQFLMRRLRRLQGKQLETHVKSQLKSFADFQHQNLQTVASRAIRPNSSDFESGLFHSDDVKSLSTSALVSLVRKLQSSQAKVNIDHHLVSKKAKVETRGVLVMDRSNAAESSRVAGHLQANLSHWGNTVDSDATESSSGGESCDENDDFLKERKPLPTPLHKRAEWKWAVDRAAIVARWTWLQAQVSDLEYRIRQQSEIHKTIRASKGAVVLGEPSVPEHLSRLNPARGVGPSGDSNLVPFDKKTEASPCNIATLLINVNRQASKLTQSLGNCYSPLQNQSVSKTQPVPPTALNGFIDGISSSHSNLQSTPQTHTSQSESGGSCRTPANGVSAERAGRPAGDGASSSHDSPDLSQPLDATCQASRCRPVRSYRKRKVLRTAGLHQSYAKAARLSSVKCQCYPPVVPCAMCGGRYNNFQRLDAEGMPITEKVSLLDPAYHPVLSFPQEIPLPVHFEALLKSGEWQTVKPPNKASLRAIAAEKRKQKLITATLKDQVRKNRKKLTKSAAAVLLSSAKLRNKYEGKSPRGNSLPGTPKKKVTAETRLRRKELKRRRAAQLAIAALKKSNHDESLMGMDQDGMGSRTATPSPQIRDANGLLSGSCSSATLKELKESWKKKRGENAYDINNIVIPYSMAASTRVEKLQYKEIPTPKWRDTTLDDETVPDEGKMDTAESPADEVEEEGEEDVSEEAFLQRHAKCEAEEKKRFMSFISYPPIRRSRVSRESESNTPDPLSPDNSLNESHLSTALLLQDTKDSRDSKEDSRRRSGSTSSSRRSSLFLEMYGRDSFGESRSSMGLAQEPWPKREFPLKEEEYNEMKLEQLQCMPLTTRLYTRARVVKMAQDMEFVTPFRPDSPTGPVSPTASTSSASLQEDPNDPEWNETNDKAAQKTVVIKLSKR